MSIIKTILITSGLTLLILGPSQVSADQIQAASPPQRSPLTQEARIDPESLARGREVYLAPTGCVLCHQKNGEGLPGAFPPLVKSPWVLEDDERAIKIVLNGLYGEMEVNGKRYNSAMAPLGGVFNDQQIADVLTFIRNSWGNQGPAVTQESVAKVREETAHRSQMWSVKDLLKEHPLPQTKVAAQP